MQLRPLVPELCFVRRVSGTFLIDEPEDYVAGHQTKYPKKSFDNSSRPLLIDTHLMSVEVSNGQRTR